MTYGFRGAVWGFAFGTVGLYVLASLSLISPVFEMISAPLMLPGRYAASIVAGSDGSNVEVAFLAVFSGVVYAIIFGAIGMMIRRPV